MLLSIYIFQDSIHYIGWIEYFSTRFVLSIHILLWLGWIPETTNFERYKFRFLSRFWRSNGSDTDSSLDSGDPMVPIPSPCLETLKVRFFNSSNTDSWSRTLKKSDSLTVLILIPVSVMEIWRFRFRFQTRFWRSDGSKISLFHTTLIHNYVRSGKDWIYVGSTDERRWQ